MNALRAILALPGVEALGGARAVDDRAVSPAWGSQSPPVDHEPRLREREARKDADREERNQLVGVATDGDEQESGHAGEHPDTAVKHLTVATQAEEVG